MENGGEMKSISLYSARFRALEYFSYILLAVPWLAGALGDSFLRPGAAGLVLKAVLSAVILTFILLLRGVRRRMNSLDSLKRNLALAAIHDLKGPLTAIIGALAIVEEPGIDPEVKEKLLKVAAQSSKDMVKLIQVLLDTERMEIAQLLLQKRPLAIRPLIAEAIASLEPVSVETGISLTVSAAPDLPPVYADHDLLMRVLENLVLNAFKYSRRGGEIRVKGEYLSGVFRFEVADSGSGIPPEDIKRVFEKYYQVEGQDARSRKGSGFGLYFCRLAVEAHKGRIAIDSVKGRGTTVSFELPGGD